MNLPSYSNRRASLAGGAILIFSVILIFAWRPAQYLMMPPWRKTIEREFRPLSTAVYPPLPNTPDGRACAPHREIFFHLRNDIIRRPRWTMEEAKYLATLIRAGYPLKGAVADEEYDGMHEDFYRYTNHSEAVTLVIARIGFGAPIDDDARMILEQTLRDELSNALELRRYDAAHQCVVYGAVTDTTIRRWVEAAIPTLSAGNNWKLSQLLRYQDEGNDAVKKYKALKEGGSDATKP